MSVSDRCDACGRALYDPESIARRHGRHCAEKAGLLTKRPPRARKLRQQLDFAFYTGLPVETLGRVNAAVDELEALGVAPAAWPWVLEARAAAKALGRVPVDGCPGCTQFGSCALHGPPGPPAPPAPPRAPAPERDLSTLPPPGLSMGKRRRSVVRSPKT